MKILVDEIPEYAYECLFGKEDSCNRVTCGFSNNICRLQRGTRCPFLTQPSCLKPEDLSIDYEFEDMGR
jgi:hypothetical protein